MKPLSKRLKQAWFRQGERKKKPERSAGGHTSVSEERRKADEAKLCWSERKYPPLAKELRKGNDYECDLSDARTLAAAMGVSECQFAWLLEACVAFLPLDTAIYTLRLLQSVFVECSRYGQNDDWFWRQLYKRDFGELPKLAHGNAANDWRVKYRKEAERAHFRQKNSLLRNCDGSFDWELEAVSDAVPNKLKYLLLTSSSQPKARNTTLFWVQSQTNSVMTLLARNEGPKGLYSLGAVSPRKVWHSKKTRILSAVRIQNDDGHVVYQCLTKISGYGFPLPCFLYADWFSTDPLAAYCGEDGVVRMAGHRTAEAEMGRYYLECEGKGDFERVIVSMIH